MKLLLPLGLIALAAILILLLIYLIRPNFQNKYTSTNFVWALSLKLKKKRRNVSKLRNILLIICQVLILALAAFILSKPVRVILAEPEQKESIAIIDSSASMLAENDAETRFERAVRLVRKQAIETVEAEGLYSVILADSKPSFVVQRSNLAAKQDMLDSIDELVEDQDNLACSYANSNVDEAINLCEDILIANNSAVIYLYTDKTYNYVPKGVTVVNVNEQDEFNVAILDAYVEFNEGYFDIIADVASYGKDLDFGLYIKVRGANVTDSNPDGEEIILKPENYTIYCSGDEVNHIVYKATSGVNANEDQITYFDISGDKFTDFDSISLSVDINDSYMYDNVFEIYGGKKEEIKIQYIASKPNTFVTAALLTLTNHYAENFDITYIESRDSYISTGFDYYIFEHAVPEELPTDGVVILLDPMGTAPSKANYKYNGIEQFSKSEYLIPTLENQDHPLLKNLSLDEVTVTRIDKLKEVSADYTVLAEINGFPALLYKDDANSKVFIMSFSVNYSNIVVLPEWPWLFANIFEYFTPCLVESNAYEIYESATISNRGDSVEIAKDNKLLTTMNALPASYQFVEPGIYEVTQETVFNKQLDEKIYVRLPKAESNLFETVDSFQEPYHHEEIIDMFDDLIFYFALALVLLIYLEWWLKGRDNQ